MRFDSWSPMIRKPPCRGVPNISNGVSIIAVRWPWTTTPDQALLSLSLELLHRQIRQSMSPQSRTCERTLGLLVKGGSPEPDMRTNTGFARERCLRISAMAGQIAAAIGSRSFRPFTAASQISPR